MSTPNFNLPIFVSTDKPSWLGDWNSAMNSIDTAMQANKTAAAKANQDVTAVTANVTALQSQVTAIGQMVDSHGTEIDATEARVDALEQTVDGLGNPVQVSSLPVVVFGLRSAGTASKFGDFTATSLLNGNARIMTIIPFENYFQNPFAIASNRYQIGGITGNPFGLPPVNPVVGQAVTIYNIGACEAQGSGFTPIYAFYSSAANQTILLVARSASQIGNGVTVFNIPYNTAWNYGTITLTALPIYYGA